MQTTGHNNRILIKTSATTPNIAVSDNTLMVGELGYSYAGANSDGGGRLFIGVSLVEGDSDFATAIHEIGGKYYTDMMDHDRGHVVANSVLITDSSNKIDFLQVDNLILDGNTIENDNSGITIDGFGNVTLITNGAGHIDVDSNRIINVANPVNPMDAVNKRFFVDAVTNVRADNRQSQWNVFDANDELHLIGGKNITTFMEVPNAGNLDVTVKLNDSVDGLTSITIDNVKIDGNTIKSLVGNLVIDPTPDGSSGTLVVQGNLQVEGTTTTINSTELTINDKNIVLADGAADSAQADGGGITLDGANATIIYDASTDQWVFNKDVSAPNLDVVGDFTSSTLTGKYLGFDSDLLNSTTDGLPEGNTNLYYTQARFDSALNEKTTSDIAEGSNLYYTTTRADSDARSALSVANPAGFGTLLYDSATGKFTFTGVSTPEIRAQFSAGGDITYNESTGTFSLDVEQIYTADNFDSDFRDRLQITTTDSIGEGTSNLYYTKTRVDSDFDSKLLLKTTDDLAEGSTNLYYTTPRADSDARHSISVVDGGGPGSLDYNNNTGVITYIGPSPAELAVNIRPQFSAEGDLNYNESTGVFSIDVEVAYTKVNFDSDLGTASTTDLPEGTNLYYTQGRFDSALGDKSTDNITEGSNQYFTNERVDDRVNDLLVAGQAIDLVYSDVLNTLAIGAEIATTTNFGVSRYDSVDFSVTAGMVEINTIDCGTY
jgi:hypothetical protein